MILSIKKTLLLILGLALVIGAIASPHHKSKKPCKKSSKKLTKKNSPPPVPIPTGPKNTCRSFTDKFQNSRIVNQSAYNGDPTSADWIDTCGVPGTYTQSNGLNLNLLKPADQQRTKGDDGYYNKVLGEGFSCNSTYKMLYGSVSMILKANGVGGCVSALVCMSENGDEIDWEMVGKDTKHAQSNYFYDRMLIYGVNGGVHEIPKNGQIDTDFHNYTIDWSPDYIKWYIDGSCVRTLERADTYVNGTYRFPCHPSYVQMGIWDGSGAVGTAQWSNGPIDWTKQPSQLTSTIQQISITCNPDYNQVIN
ncbi:concanavalin A-like lectin/glucanase [Gigaspora margarita]|uniref:Concanavalin A-like lectin/glucanase n=1 Tax=Gigaspora margarita TaxID=4874 RepID=A0A8H3XDG2_GIGMA|nr:concanavalin A-like lectin/glucanase [Gigaspora margarita]